MALRSTKAKHRVYHQGADGHWYFEAAFVEFEDAQSWVHWNTGSAEPKRQENYRIMFENKTVFNKELHV